MGRPSSLLILNVSLQEIMRWEFSLPLRAMLRIYTVGGLLRAWSYPETRDDIESIFDSPQQARHVVSVCATWLGIRSTYMPFTEPPAQWWLGDAAQAPLDPLTSAAMPNARNLAA